MILHLLHLPSLLVACSVKQEVEALRWFGYLVAAVLVLGLLVGFGGFIATIAFVGGALAALVCIVVILAAAIKEACGSK